MKNHSIDINTLIASTRLSADYLSGNSGNLIGNSFLDIGAPAKVAASIDGHGYHRGKLYEIIRDGNIGFDSSDKTMSNIELLKEPDSLCVFAGQQTGVMAGPMYTVYKALATVKLAEKYRTLLGRPVVPCFWMATDDHDFDEVRSANFLSRTGEPINVTYNPEKEYGGIPVAEMFFDNGARDFINSVEESLLDTEFKSNLVAFLKEIYRPGARLAEAFARLFNRFLFEFGIVLVDPNFPGLKELFKEIFIKEIEHHEQTFELFKRRSEQLQKLGYHNQVHKSGETLNLFYHNPARVNIRVEGDKLLLGNNNQEYFKSWLVDEVEKSPNQFSPNVLLRPIAQCHVFPTLCQITGPSELAYYVQIMPLFDFFDTPAPIIFPRPGITLIEPHIGKILDRYELEVGRLRNKLDSSISAVIERLFPSDAAQMLTSLQDKLKSDLSECAQMLENADSEGYQLVSNFQKRFDFELKELQKKLKTTNKKRHDDISGQIKKAHDFLYPNNNLQERIVSPVYYAAKYGQGIFNNIYSELDIENLKHILLEL
jgi:bacillithiol synthase